MSILLFSLVVLGIVILVSYTVWYFMNEKKVNSKVSDFVIEKDNKDKIIETVYKESAKKKNGLVSGIVGNHISKMDVFYMLDISPYILRNCIKELMKEELIIETDESIALTSFGVQYHEIFIRRMMSKKKAKK